MYKKIISLMLAFSLIMSSMVFATDDKIGDGVITRGELQSNLEEWTYDYLEREYGKNYSTEYPYKNVLKFIKDGNHQDWFLDSRTNVDVSDFDIREKDTISNMTYFENIINLMFLEENIGLAKNMLDNSEGFTVHTVTELEKILNNDNSSERASFTVSSKYKENVNELNNSAPKNAFDSNKRLIKKGINGATTAGAYVAVYAEYIRFVLKVGVEVVYDSAVVEGLASVPVIYGNLKEYAITNKLDVQLLENGVRDLLKDKYLLTTGKTYKSEIWYMGRKNYQEFFNEIYDFVPELESTKWMEGIEYTTLKSIHKYKKNTVNEIYDAMDVVFRYHSIGKIYENKEIPYLQDLKDYFAVQYLKSIENTMRSINRLY